MIVDVDFGDGRNTCEARCDRCGASMCLVLRGGRFWCRRLLEAGRCGTNVARRPRRNRAVALGGDR